MSHLASGIRHLHSQRWHDAISDFNQVLSIDAGDHQAIRGRLIACVSDDDLDGAMDAIGQAAEHGVNDWMTRRLRSGVLIAKERYQESLSDLNWLIEADPNSFGLLRDRGLVNLQLGHFQQSLNDLDRAIEIKPLDTLTLNNRGATLIQLGRLDEAIENLEQALQIDPTFERPLHHLDHARELLCQR